MISTKRICLNLMLLFALMKNVTSPPPPSQLVIVTPQDQANLISGVPFTVLVTSADPAESIDITLEFDGDITSDSSAITNVPKSVTLGAEYLGSTTLSVIAPSPYIAPADITLSFKNGVTFIYAPREIVPNIPFNVYLQKSIPIVYELYSTVSVYLTCDDVQIMSWSRVKMNQLSTLSGIPADTPSQSNCLLTTTSNFCYYPASASVSIVPSPTGSQLYPITPAQEAQFAIEIAFSPGIIVV